MELEAVAKALKKLGHPTRLSIYKEVVKAGYKGIAVSGVQEKLGFCRASHSTPRRSNTFLCCRVRVFR
ncbi:hypothetical protein ATG66_0419 [Vibrio sp. ES.051]|nr:hypothetical protein ATG66_0419 [Vibrio sp. ES.051]